MRSEPAVAGALPGEPAIACRGLSAGYPGSVVLRDLSFTVAAGELVGVLGPNGAGKTTLFRVLTGLLPVPAGQVRLFGHDVATLPAAERARLVGVVPQELDSPMAFRVDEVVLMGRTARLSRWRAPSARDRQAVDDALRFVDMVQLRDRPFPELSGGEKQRVLIALVLAQAPRLVLLDEATSHLDLRHKLDILELVERLNREQGVTVLMSSHDLALTADACRRLLLFDRGRLAADGAPAELLGGRTVREVFRCELRVQRDPESGALVVFPLRRRGDAPGV
jgi:iron complex transport system ATP-binding protein